MSKSKERRQHPRLARDERVVIQIVSSSEDTLQAGMIVRCSSMDISANGLKIQTQHRVSDGTQVELWAEISGYASKFYLSGEVKWCRETEKHDGYQVGIELTDGQAQDLALWQGVFEEPELPAAGEA